MYLEAVKKLVNASNAPVILLAGIRKLPVQDRHLLVALGEMLAKELPAARFRTGNAEGADDAFAEGVRKVDPARLEYVLPKQGYRKSRMPGESYRIGFDELSLAAEEAAVYETVQASPQYAGLMEWRHSVSQLSARSRYLLRDAVMVAGAAEPALAPALIGIFYVNADDPMAGGTGHTLRVCQRRGVPVVRQREWMKWLANNAKTEAYAP